MSQLSPQDVLDLIGDNSEYFSVQFRKRTTGEDRTLNCQRRVRKHLKGGKAAYSFTDKGLISVWCPKEAGKHGPKDVGYRSVPADAIQQIKAGGRVWENRDGSFVEIS